MAIRSLLACLICTAAATWASLAQGSIAGSNQLSIDFCNPNDAAAKASWSLHEKLTITAHGLGWDGGPAELLDDVWIHTKPLAVGLSWRPATSVGLKVTIEPTPAPILLNSGQSHVPHGGAVYARFSPDLKHWSSWQVLDTPNPLPKVATGRIFNGSLGVPERERREYSALIAEYSRLDVPWASDEEAGVAWIISRDARFFERSLPFIGYVEFLFEASLHGGQRISSFQAVVGYGMSGLHLKAKNPEVARDRHVPWRYQAP